MHKDGSPGCLKGNIGNVFTIRGPGRRYQRVIAFKHHAFISTVDIGDQQAISKLAITPLYGRDIQQTRTKGAANTGQFFIDTVTDLVGYGLRGALNKANNIPSHGPPRIKYTTPA